MRSRNRGHGTSRDVFSGRYDRLGRPIMVSAESLRGDPMGVRGGGRGQNGSQAPVAAPPVLDGEDTKRSGGPVALDRLLGGGAAERITEAVTRSDDEVRAKVHSDPDYAIPADLAEPESAIDTFLTKAGVSESDRSRPEVRDAAWDGAVSRSEVVRAWDSIADHGPSAEETAQAAQRFQESLAQMWAEQVRADAEEDEKKEHKKRKKAKRKDRNSRLLGVLQGELNDFARLTGMDELVSAMEVVSSPQGQHAGGSRKNRPSIRIPGAQVNYPPGSSALQRAAMRGKVSQNLQPLTGSWGRRMGTGNSSAVSDPLTSFFGGGGGGGRQSTPVNRKPRTTRQGGQVEAGGDPQADAAYRRPGSAGPAIEAPHRPNNRRRSGSRP